MKKIRRVLLLAFVLSVLLGCLMLHASAAEVVASGYCGGEGDGTNVQWELDSNGTLTISGTGAMKYWYPSENTTTGLYSTSAPWGKLYYEKPGIKKAVFEDGVTSVGRSSLAYAPDLEEVVIAGSVSKIETQAFHSCKKLKTVVLNEGLTSFGDNVFMYSSALTEIVIPNSVENLGTNTFYECTGLQRVVIGSGVTTGGSFCYCSSLKEVVLVDGLKKISNFMFNNCSALERITIPDSVETVGDNAFSLCPSLSEVNFGSGVKEIGYRAFYQCRNLTSVNLPAGLTTVGEEAFYESGLSDVYFNGNAPTTVGTRAFYSETYLSFVTIHHPESATGWTDGEAYNPDTGKWNGYPLAECKGMVLRSGYIGNSDVDRSNVRWELTNDGVLYFYGNGAMYDPPRTEWPEFSKLSFRKVVIEPGITSITSCAFFGTSLMEITIPDGVTYIQENAFSGCARLKEIVIPDSVTEIGGSAFNGCTSLTKVTLGKGLTNISSSVFFSCAALEEVVIPANITEIGTAAFGGSCDKLKSVWFEGDASSVYPASHTRASFLEKNVTLYYTPGTSGWTDSEAYDAKTGTWNGYKLAVWEKNTELPEVGGGGSLPEIGGGDDIFEVVLSGTLAAIEVSMADELLLWQKFTLPDELINDDDAYAVVTADKKGGLKETVIPMTEIRAKGADKNGRYIIEQGMAAPEMGRSVTVSFVDGNGNYVNLTDYSTGKVSTSVSRTIVDYSKLALEKGNTNQKNLNKALLTYGGYSQLYFNVDASAPVYNNLTALGIAVPDLKGITDSSIAQEMTSSGASLVTPTTQQAFLDSAVYHRVYFTLNSGVKIGDLRFELTKRNKTNEFKETVEAVYESGKNRYYVQIDGIASPLLDYMYDLKISNSSGHVQNVKTSVAAYLKLGISKSTNVKQVNMFKAMYNYNQVANEFFGF